MSAWKLEVSRLVRTRRLVALFGVFGLFGLLGPVLTRYIGVLLEWSKDSLGGAQIIAPEPTVVAALASYEKNATQVGLIVVVAIAASAAAVDATPQIGMFFRTRVASAAQILAPRALVVAAAVALASAVGLLASWYETAVLIGPVPARAIVGGLVAGISLSAFVVAVTVMWAQIARGLLGAILWSIGTVVLLPVIAIVPALAPYVPTSLASASSALAADAPLGDVAPAVGTSLALAALAFWVATRRFARREVSG